MPRDQQTGATGSGRHGPPSGADPADEPVTGPPAGAAGSSGPAGATAISPAEAGAARPGASRPGVAGPGAAGPGAAGPGAAAPGTGAAGAGLGATAAKKDSVTSEGDNERRLRRRRRLFVAGISIGAALVAIALCAGTVGLVSAVDGFRDRSAEARENRELRDADCLALEQRLNRLDPPGAADTPAARAVAIRDENAAVRIYVNAIHSQRDQEAWRQLLDARTAYAEALAQQGKSSTPAFYVPPRAPDDRTVSDHLVQWSPPACAGPIRRLAVPDL